MELSTLYAYLHILQWSNLHFLHSLYSWAASTAHHYTYLSRALPEYVYINDSKALITTKFYTIELKVLIHKHKMQLKFCSVSLASVVISPHFSMLGNQERFERFFAALYVVTGHHASFLGANKMSPYKVSIQHLCFKYGQRDCSMLVALAIPHLRSLTFDKTHRAITVAGISCHRRTG